MAFVDDEDTITERAAQRWATAQPPRLAKIKAALVRHLHAFARKVRITEAELADAFAWPAAVGHAGDGKRQKFALASDLLGLSTLVVQLNNRLQDGGTPPTLLGPSTWWFSRSPSRPRRVRRPPGRPSFITGTVTDTQGCPVPDAVLDVWHADSDGKYEARIAGADGAPTPQAWGHRSRVRGRAD
ncbi:dioxygenase [Streptomyces sp. NPDC001339]|uniref:dioxygenase n=1 Tax=Streptomyces sp. NPDC001339 TaxID=3364563 RepID=UPI00369F05B0